ncbi:hypothetical protein [Microbispora rosea]|uniref:hypothetical protein n=1 Tax=Microbispora rosea TaxID=58117 RepID=UPI003795A737
MTGRAFRALLLHLHVIERGMHMLVHGGRRGRRGCGQLGAADAYDQDGDTGARGGDWAAVPGPADGVGEQLQAGHPHEDLVLVGAQA